MTRNIPTPKKVLSVFAHPDDADFSSSGTLAKWAEAGSEVTYLICTDGSKGSDDPAMTREKLAAMRKQEQLNAAEALGAKDVIFLNHVDGELTADYTLKEDIAKVIRQLQPDCVITADPMFLYSTERGFVNHSDHRAAGQAAIDAVFPLARDRLNFPHHEKEGIGPHKVATLLLVAFERAEHIEDITTTIETKIQVLKAHRSQVPGSEELAERIKERAAALGREASVAYAEGFKKIELS